MSTRKIPELDGNLRSDAEYSQALANLQPYEALARRLIAFRVERGLTQARLARLCKTTQPAIARLESGEHEPRIETLRKVAHALGGALVLEVEFDGGRREKLAVL